MGEVIIYPGSFNPVHNGHLAVASYVASSGLCDELWLMVSPQNPLKKNESLVKESDRLEMVRIAVKEFDGPRNIVVSDIETALPTPSYTVETLRYLEKTYPETRFSLLAGTDILTNIHRWKESEYLLRNYRIYIYPRAGSDFEKLAPGMVYLNRAPKIDVSSTEIRKTLAEGGDLAMMLPGGVISYIYDKGLWVDNGAALRLGRLGNEIAEGSIDPAVYLERGKLNYKFSKFGKALNDFLRMKELDPENTQAEEYIKLLNDIFEFRHTDIYNP